MPTARFFVSSFALGATALLWLAANPPALAHQNAPPARTPDQNTILPLDGARIFRNYCASCHGVNGSGDGPVASALKIKVPLLTTLALRNHGTFPGEGSSPIPNFRFSQGDVRFFFGGQAEGIRNDRSAECRNVTVEFLNPKVTSYSYQTEAGWVFSAGAISAPVDPHVKFVNGINLGAAVAQYVHLLAGDSFPAPEKPAAELLIPITDVDLRKQDDTHIRKSPGDAVWIGEGRKSALTNASNSPARFAVLDLWIQQAE
jgi:hypothetical protein